MKKYQLFDFDGDNMPRVYDCLGEASKFAEAPGRLKTYPNQFIIEVEIKARYDFKPPPPPPSKVWVRSEF